MSSTNLVLSFPPFRLEVAAERLSCSGKVIALSPRRFTLLRYFAERPQRLVTQAELLENVWGQAVMSESLVRTNVRALRRVLGRDTIETVVGRGYRFLPAVSRTTGKSRRFAAEPSAHGRHADCVKEIAALHAVLRAMAGVIQDALGD